MSDVDRVIATLRELADEHSSLTRASAAVLRGQRRVTAWLVVCTVVIVCCSAAALSVIARHDDFARHAVDGLRRDCVEARR